MAAPYPTKAVANAFLNKGFADKVAIDPLKIQKLVYYAAGYYLAASGVPLVNEAFEAWDKGPVIPSLYHEFKQYGYSSIKRLAEEIDWDEEDALPVPPPQNDKRFDKVLDFVWSRYGRRDSLDLSELSHAEGGPWDRARKENVFNLRNKDIPEEYIKDYFLKFVKKRAQ